MAKRIFKTNKFKFIVLFVLVFALVVALIGVTVRLNGSISTKTVSSFDFVRGGINSAGQEYSDEGHIRSGFITVDGLEIKIAEDATVKYKVSFYGSDKTYLASTSALDENFEESDIADVSGCKDNSNNILAKYCRVEITPNSDLDISLFEILDYAGQLEITYNK